MESQKAAEDRQNKETPTTLVGLLCHKHSRLLSPFSKETAIPGFYSSEILLPYDKSFIEQASGEDG